MKKFMSIFIVLAILRITYQYVETVGIYQAEVTKRQIISVVSGDLLETMTTAAESNGILTEAKAAEGISKETSVQYPLIATPSNTEWIDLVIVSDGNYCIFDGDKYGFIAENGDEITPCIYDIAYPFNEGLACVCKDGKYGYIDLNGEVALPFEYDRATPFVEGLAYFSIGDTYGFMDKTGTPTLYFECDSISSFQEGLAYFSIDGRYGYVDQSGQIAIKAIFDDAGYFKDGLANVMKDGRYGVINRDGKFIIAAEYDLIKIYGSFIITQSEGQYACFDITGKELLEQGQADEIYTTWRDEYAYFIQEGKMGLIDENGNILIEPIYDWILLPESEQNFLIVRDNELYGIIDLHGEVREPIAYSYIDCTNDGIFRLTDSDGNVECIDASYFSDNPSDKIPDNHDDIGKEETSIESIGYYDHMSNYDVYGCYDNIYIITDYDSDIHNSIIKTGEPEQIDISGALLQNEITPRIGLYQEFTRSGSIYVEDMRPSGHTVSLEDMREYRKTYKLYDLDHSGKPILYFYAKPYSYNNFPESYSGFYAIQDNQLVEQLTGYQCGGSWRGDFVCLWYDRETSQVLPGTNGIWREFGENSHYGAAYDRKNGEMKKAASFGYITQTISSYSDEDFKHAELLYNREGEPYTKEMVMQAEKGDIARQYFVNEVHTTKEEYQGMWDRYQMLDTTMMQCIQM